MQHPSNLQLFKWNAQYLFVRRSRRTFIYYVIQHTRAICYVTGFLDICWNYVCLLPHIQFFIFKQNNTIRRSHLCDPSNWIIASTSHTISYIIMAIYKYLIFYLILNDLPQTYRHRYYHQLTLLAHHRLPGNHFWIPSVSSWFCCSGLTYHSSRHKIVNLFFFLVGVIFTNRQRDLSSKILCNI